MASPVQEARRLLHRLEVNLDANNIPVRVREIAERLGARVVDHSLDDELCGMIFKNEEGIVIGVNSNHLLTRQRFTIAHEIGHLIMHRHVLEGDVHVDRAFSVQLNRDKRSALGEDLLEIQANQFAAELLMPTESIRKEIKNRYIDIEDGVETERLADKYEVSVQAMSIKLFNIFSEDFELLE